MTAPLFWTAQGLSRSALQMFQVLEALVRTLHDADMYVAMPTLDPVYKGQSAAKLSLMLRVRPHPFRWIPKASRPFESKSPPAQFSPDHWDNAEARLGCSLCIDRKESRSAPFHITLLSP